MNNTDSHRYIIDVETAPLADAADYLEPVDAPANYKDQAKIAEYIAAKQAEAVNRAALDMDLCRIVAVGYQCEHWAEPEVATCVTEEREAGVLRLVWEEIDRRATIGYNTLGFDLPVLMRRSLYLGVSHPIVSIDKYRTTHIDLQMRLSHNGAMKFRPLSFYCRRFGIPCNDPISGKDIGALVLAGEWDTIAAHCRADVLKTKALAERMGIIQRQPSLAF